MLTAPLIPQPSERWAMYRLICPIVDAAALASGLVPYFELSQPNGPNKRLSADIALVSGDKPVWLVEAKKFTKRLDPGLIAPYLSPDVMGVVTNGNHWVFVLGDEVFVAGPVLSETGSPNAKHQEAIISVLSSTNLKVAAGLARKSLSRWSEYVVSRKPTVWTINKGLGTREFAERTIYQRLSDVLPIALSLVVENSATESLLEELEETGAEIPIGYLELSENRLVWWLRNGLRGIRLNLKSRQIDMLSSSALLDAVGRAHIQASLKMHDKNHDMYVVRATELDEIRSLVPLFSARVSA